MRREVEDVPELMQHIQSRLPLKEAARTSLLSKSWLLAWSTNPTLRFHVYQERNRPTSMKFVDVDRTLLRYPRDNILINRFELLIDIENQEQASHAEKWIAPVVTKTCLKECHLRLITFDSTISVDMDDLRTRLQLPPATNVQQMWFETREDECMWERSLFFDAFFMICHPKRIYARPDMGFKHNNHFCRLMLREVLEKKTTTTWGLLASLPETCSNKTVREWS
ncbi:hypothetical protein L1887_39427 [Cichorium endivia]|nr:hypothetical protein L1887_39427 [Cichorium endivia]